MPKTEWRPRWQVFAICGTIIIGFMAITMTGTDIGTAIYRHMQVVHGHNRNCRALNDSCNRYEMLRFACKRAQENISDTYGLNEFVASGGGPLLRADQERAEQAMAILREITRVTPDEDGAWSDLAWLSAISGDTGAAISQEQEAISLYPYDYTYYVVLGVFFERSGHIDKAQAAYEQALILYPRLARSQFWHNLELRRHGLAEATMQLAVEVLNQKGSGVNDMNHNEVRARLDAEDGQLVLASSIIRSINEQLPNLSGSWELQGELHEKEGSTQRAILDYRRAIFLDKTDPLPHEQLAELYLTASDAGTAKMEALAAWQLARRLESPGSLRRAILYRRYDDPHSSQLPTTLMDETQPAFDFEAAFTRLKTIFANQGASEEAKEMQDMSDQATSHSALYGDTESDQ